MTTLNKALDLITFGEIYVDLCGEQIGAELKDTFSFRKFVGGIAATVAIGGARLGLKTALISGIAHDEMGKFLLEALQRENVNTTHLKSFPEKSSTLIMRAIHASDVNVGLFQNENPASKGLMPGDIQPAFIASSQALLIVASNFAHEKMSECSSKALIAARENGTKVILFLDQGADNPALNTLHEKEAFIKRLLNIVPQCDLIFGSEAAFLKITESTDIDAALKQLRTLGNAILVLKHPEGCYAFASHIPSTWQETIHYPTIALKNRYAVEGMDAFIAGFLKGWLQNNSLEKCCQLSMFCQAIAQSQPNNMDYLPSEQGLFVATTQSPHSLEQTLHSAHFTHMHYTTTRPQPLEKHFIFQLGSLQQWEKISQTYPVDDAFIQKTKALVAKGVAIAAQGNPFAAIIIDEENDLDLFHLQPASYRLIRSVDTPQAVPFQFKNNPDITQTLLQWPQSQRVKATAIYHPDDRYALRGQQEMTLNLLHRSCRETKHELFLELAPPANSLITASTIAHIMQRFYEIGIYPDGWIISVPRDQRSWDSIAKVISDNDPYCQGVVVSTPAASLEQLNMIFDIVSKQKCCQGFIAGKNLFHPLLEQWFNQKLTEHAFIDMVATSFHQVMLRWEQSMKISDKELVPAI